MPVPEGTIQIECPACLRLYASSPEENVNLSIGEEEIDVDSLRQSHFKSCPHCGHKVDVASLVVDQRGTFRRKR